jgi:hypothetical protein
MFIADGPAPDSSPQRGDMFSAVALGEQFFTAAVDECKGSLKPFFGTKINWMKHVTPLG